MAEPAPGHGRFRGRISIPYLDKNGKALGVRFRCFEQHDHRENKHGKYDSIAGEPTRVFNVGAIHRAAREAEGILHITEGEFDAIVLTMLGYDAIAIAGAQSWKYHYGRMIAGFNKVLVWGDPDDAGSEFVQKVSKAHRGAVGVHLTHGDVTETYGAGGEVLIARLIEGSV